VPEAEEGGADAELQYVEVSEGTTNPQTNCADEGKPRCINPSVLKLLRNYLRMFVLLCSGVGMKPVDGRFWYT
jgi:hypothetical protein